MRRRRDASMKMNLYDSVLVSERYRRDLYDARCNNANKTPYYSCVTRVTVKICTTLAVIIEWSGRQCSSPTHQRGCVTHPSSAREGATWSADWNVFSCEFRASSASDLTPYSGYEELPIGDTMSS